MCLKNDIKGFLIIILFFSVVKLCSQSHIYEAELYHVHDGDTFKAKMYVPDFSDTTYNDFKTEIHTIRVHGCDTYEMDSDIIEEAILATKGRYATYSFLENGKFLLKYNYKDWYGRLVCDVINKDGESLCDKLRKKKLLTGKYEDK